MLIAPFLPNNSNSPYYFQVMSDSDSDAENEAEDQNASPPSPPPPQVNAYYKMKFN